MKAQILCVKLHLERFHKLFDLTKIYSYFFRFIISFGGGAGAVDRGIAPAVASKRCKILY